MPRSTVPSPSCSASSPLHFIITQITHRRQKLTFLSLHSEPTPSLVDCYISVFTCLSTNFSTSTVNVNFCLKVSDFTDLCKQMMPYMMVNPSNPEKLFWSHLCKIELKIKLTTVFVEVFFKCHTANEGTYMYINGHGGSFHNSLLTFVIICCLSCTFHTQPSWIPNKSFSLEWVC